MKRLFELRVILSGATWLSFNVYAFGSDIKIGGNLFSVYSPVSYALVTFISNDDTLKRFSALTDGSGNFSIDVVTSVSLGVARPGKFQLAPNYPNPFSSSTAIPYLLERRSTPIIRIFNVLGAIVKEFSLGEQTAGNHEVIWDGTNDCGMKVASGVYFYQLSAQGMSQTRRLVLAKGDGSLSYMLNTSYGYRENQSAVGRTTLSETGSYTVLIQSIDTTKPPIVTKQISNLILLNDTTLTFSVEELNDFAFCYNRGLNGVGQVFLNNVKGTHPRDISNYTDGDDGYSQWSPNGRYIVFQRSVPVFGPLTVVYDIQNITYTNLTSDRGLSASLPQWTPNGKVCFAYHRPVSSLAATYLMNPDGTGSQKILDSVATQIYFYPDSYRFLYIMDWTRVYRTNIDGTFNEFVGNLEQISSQGIAAQGFNPASDELLIVYYSPVDSVDRIATYNVTTKNIRDLYLADAGYHFNQIIYSEGGQQIAAVEHSDLDEWLSVVAGGAEKRLVRIPQSDPIVHFSFEPIRFSPDGSKISFSEEQFNVGPYATWTQVLYVVDVSSGIIRRIDIGWNPSWFHHN